MMHGSRCRVAVGGAARRGFSSSTLPKEADVVVVGGGSLGTSVLYHLRRRGLSCVLLEKDKLTSGTTWHSAGMLWRLRPSDIDIQLHAHTREMCKTLEKETGIASWTENGGLFICTNEERMREYRRLHETGKYFGIESRLLKPHEIPQVHPLIATGDVFGGMHSPGDGTIDPTGIVNAYARAAKRLGAQIFEDNAVVGIESIERGNNVRSITGVRTASGELIKTKWVVNAAGAWANGLAAMVGAKLPLLAMKHAFVVTERLPGMHPGLPNVRDHDLSIYLKTSGDSMQIGGYEPNPEFWDKPTQEFAFGLFELDWETFGANLEGHMKRCPAIEKAGIKSTVCGPESFTPDHKPLVGPQPGVRGFFNACGFNSMGMMLGGGMGREIATWIVEGSPSLDIFSFDCSRFHPGSVSDAMWVKDRTHESYAKTYSIVFPHDESLAGRGSRKSPLHDELVQRGVVHQARHGFERPGWFLPGPERPELGAHVAEALAKQGAMTPRRPGFGQAPLPYDYYGAYAGENGAWRLGEVNDARKSIPAHPAGSDLYLRLVETELTFGTPKNLAVIAEECRAVRTGVGIFDQSYFGKFFVEGPGAYDAMQFICGADMSKQTPGQVTYTPLCNERGGVEADLTVSRMPGNEHEPRSYYIAAGGNTATKDFEWIQTQIEKGGFRATVRDASEEICMLSVQGPHSRALLRQLITTPGCTLSDEEQPFSTLRKVHLAGIEVYLLRLTFVGELGYEIHMPAQHAVHIYRALRTAGEAYSATHGVPVRDAGYRCIDSLSAEKNFRHWHADLSNRDTPLEAMIGFTVLPKLKQPKEKAAFLGRDALVRQRDQGLQRKLVCLTLEDPTVLLHGMETIWRDGRCVGLVRSTAFGHTIGRTVAYGYADADQGSTVTNEWLEKGVWQVGDKGKLHAAKLSLQAPFDPKNQRVKGIYE